MYLFLFWRLYSRGTLRKYTPKYSSLLASIIVPILQYVMLTNQFWKGGLFKGNRTSRPSLLPFQSRWCKTGSSSFVLPPGKAQTYKLGSFWQNSPTSWAGPGQGFVQAAPEQPRFLPSPRARQRGLVLVKLQLSSNEIPRVAVKSLLLLVH